MSNFDGNIVIPSAWADVPQLSAACQALGGPGGPMNAQAVAMVARLNFLADAVNALDAGAALFTGSGAPANTLGKNGDVYIDPALGNLYGPKAAGVWPAAVSLAGQPGQPGGPGPAGPPGPAAFTRLAILDASATAGGSATFTFPADANIALIEAWGGGGGGGRVSAADANGNFYKGAGGAGGSYIKAMVSGVAGQTVNRIVGAPGIGAGQTGNTGSDSGTAGGDSLVTLSSGWSVTAAGGGGASSSTGGGPSPSSTTATGTVVPYVIESVTGQRGQGALSVVSAQGAAAPYYSGTGGAGAKGGAGGFGVRSYPNSSGDPASAGTFPGGAGAGADEQGYGGNGAGGKIVIWY